MCPYRKKVSFQYSPAWRVPYHPSKMVPKLLYENAVEKLRGRTVARFEPYRTPLRWIGHLIKEIGNILKARSFATNSASRCPPFHHWKTSCHCIGKCKASVY